MGKVTTILHCQWRAYWRRLVRPGSLTVGNQGILLIVSVLFLLKYVRALGLAGDEIAKGNTGSLERLLFAIGVAWLFPLLLERTVPHETSPNNKSMDIGLRDEGGTPSVVHLSNQTANFKAFILNEMSAILVILADCEFVCT